MRIGDWSSDVCSSDLKSRKAVVDRHVPVKERGQILREIACTRWLTNEELVDILTNHEEFEFPLAKEAPRNPRSAFDVRSEERRVGKACVRTSRSRGSTDPKKQNRQHHKHTHKD